MLNRFRKSYLNQTTGEYTEKASTALTWYKNGNNVQVNIYYNMPGKTGLHRVIQINGAHVETHQEKTDRENREHCERIANDLEDYSNGLVYRCPDCGEILEIHQSCVGDKYRCPECENTNDIDDFEKLSLWDYFDDVLDIEYRIGSDKQLRSVQIMVTCGGPNIYIDTATKQVELYWWGDRASYPIDYDVCNEIDYIFEEYLNC